MLKGWWLKYVWYYIGVRLFSFLGITQIVSGSLNIVLNPKQNVWMQVVILFVTFGFEILILYLGYQQLLKIMKEDS